MPLFSSSGAKPTPPCVPRGRSAASSPRSVTRWPLSEPRELLKKAQDEAGKKETALLAELKSGRSSWADKEALLTYGFHEIEDIVDGEFLYFL